MPAPQQILPARPAPFSDVSKLEIPYEHVSIKSFHKGSNGKTLIHIQDPHSNYSGQKNIAQTIERFVKRYGLKTVFVEGGYGDVTLDDLRNIASKKDWGIVAKKFLMKSLITGPEYLNLTSDLKIKLFGIEDKALYESNVLAYSKIADNRDEVRGYLHTIQSSIDRLKNRLYPKELLHYENHKSRESDEGFSSNLDTLLKLIQDTPLSDLSDYPEVLKLKNLRQTEALVNFEKINNELRKLWGLIKARDRSKDAGDFMGFFQKASHSQYAQVSLLEDLFDEAKSLGTKISEFSDLIQYYGYLKSFNSLHMDTLFEELESLEDHMYGEFLKEEDTKKIRAIDRYLGLIQKAYAINLTSAEYQMLTYNEPIFQTELWMNFINEKLRQLNYFGDLLVYQPILENSHNNMINFYALARLRDRVFVQNVNSQLEDDAEAFVITGGYHTENLTKLLKAANYSIITLTPKVDHPTDQALYERILLASIADDPRQEVSDARSPEGALASDYVGQLAFKNGMGTRTSELARAAEGRIPISEYLSGARMAGKTENEKLRDRPKKDLKQQKTGSGRILKIIYYVLLGVLGPASIYIPFLMREARNDPALAHLYQTQNRSGAPDQIKSPYEIWFQEKIEGKHPEAKKRSDINYKNLGSLFGGTWVVDSPFGGFLDLVVSELTLDQLARMSQWKAARHFQKDQTDIAELLHPFKSGLNRGDYLDSQVRETPILSVEALRELWQVFMGEPYDLYRVIEQAAMDEWPYAVGHPEKTQIPEDYISGLFYNVATADVPFETKRTYLKMLRKRSFVEQKDLPRWAMKTHDMKKLHEVMTAMNAYQWAEADEDRLLEATYFLTEMIGTDWDYNSMTADRFKKALDDHGGLAGIAEKLKDNPSLGLRFIQLRKRYDDMIPMYTVRAYYDEIANWTLEEHEYFINGSFAFSESIKMSPYTVGYFMSKAFEDGGFVVTPSFFYDLMDREKFEGILRGWLSKSFEAKDGGYAVKTIDDFKLLMKYWDELSRINQGELLLGLADFSLLPAVIDYESAANLVFKTMNSNADVITAVTLAYVPSAYSPIDPEFSSIDGPEDFKKRLRELRLLKLFQSSAKGLDKFKTYAASLITASQRRLPEYVNALTEDEFASFIVLIDHLAEGGSQMVELSEQLSRQYFLKQGWTSIPRFKDLSYVESIRTRLNEGSFVSGDKFIFHLGMAFLDENPVSADNIDDYFEIITGWMEAKDIHHDIQHLYQQIASFAANEIVTFLEANPSARKHEQYRQQLLKLGFAMDGSEASIILSGHEEMKKLMAYLSTGNYQRIGQKINSLTNFNTITIQDVETRDSARGDVEEGFELLDVLVGGKEGANVGYLVKGKTGIAKVMTAYDIGFKGGGIGREDFSSYRKGPLVADFVGAFTTAKKPTDFAMENGLVKNWIMSPSRQTAMTIVYPNGRMHIADKHDMKLSELYTDPSDLAANEDRPLDMRNRRDVMRLIRVGQQQKLSINTNLLLLREDQIAKINDGNDSRRLLLEFPPDQESPKGYFGLLALTREMSTRQAAEIAYKLGASRAMYTDTGYHDYATITVKKTVDGKQVIEIMVVGHADAVKSINRFFFYVDPKDAETPKPVEINHDKSKKPSGARMAIDETSDRPADGRDDIADDRIYRQIGTAISETRVKWAALADGPAFKFGDRMSWRYAVSNGHEYIDADGVSSSYDGIPADIEGDPATRGAFLVALDSVAENNLQHVFLPDYGNHAAIGQGSWLFGEQYIQMFTAIDNGRGFDADDDSVTIFDALKRGVGAGRWHHAGEAFTDMVQALTLTLIASNGKAALVVPAAFAQNNPLLSTTQLRILPEFPGHYVVDLDAEALPKGALVAGFKYSTDIPAADELTQMIIASLLKGLKGGQVPGAADASNAANLQNGIKIDPQPGVEGARLSSAEILAPLGLRISAMPGDEAFDVLATTFWQADGRSGLGRRVAGQMSPVAAERSQDRQIRFNEEQIVALIKCMVVDINPDTAKVPALPAWMVNQLLSTNILAGDLLMLFKTLEAVFGGLVIVDPTGELKKILPEGSKVRFVSTYADLAKNTMLLESAEVIKRLKDEGVLKGGYHVAARAHGIEVGGEGQLIAQIFLLALHAVSDQMPTGLARKQGLLETYGDYWKGSFVGEIGEGDQYLVAGEVLAIKLLRAISAAMTGAALTHSMTRSSA